MTEIPGSDAQGTEPDCFLSVRREFIGRPDRVNDIFLATATDLRRDRHFQGRGLVDVMRAIQSV